MDSTQRSWDWAAFAVLRASARPGCLLLPMHLLYLDDAGSAKNQAEDYFVLGGVSIFEPQVHWVTQKLDQLAQSICPDAPDSVEFHASEIFSRRAAPWRDLSREYAQNDTKSEIFSRRAAPWRDLSREYAQNVIKEVLEILSQAHNSVRAFACAVHKDSYPDQDPVELAFEDLCSRFDLYLGRLRNEGDRQRGLLILDKSAYETTLQKMARNFRKIGTQWGTIHNLADIPFFVDSRASRIVQLADHVAYAVFRRYDAKDTNYLDVIAHKFDRAENIVHGLSHKTLDRNCMCLACATRPRQN